MCSVPDGYGSISSWYQWFGGSSPGAGFGRVEGRSSSQTRCHFASIVGVVPVLRQKSLS